MKCMQHLVKAMTADMVKAMTADMVNTVDEPLGKNTVLPPPEKSGQVNCRIV